MRQVLAAAASSALKRCFGRVDGVRCTGSDGCHRANAACRTDNADVKRLTIIKKCKPVVTQSARPATLRDVPQTITVLNREVLMHKCDHVGEALRNVQASRCPLAKACNIGDNVNLRGFRSPDIYIEASRSGRLTRAKRSS